MPFHLKAMYIHTCYNALRYIDHLLAIMSTHVSQNPSGHHAFLCQDHDDILIESTSCAKQEKLLRSFSLKRYGDCLS